jgi:CheY-like chemotaxis protein
MNGFEACREIRQKPQVKHIPIILVTTRGEQECVEQGFVSGCNDYITKPVNGHELVLLLKNYLGE